MGVQHTGNKAAVRVCSRCFCFVGSIEAQLGLCLAAQLPGLPPGDALCKCTGTAHGCYACRHLPKQVCKHAAERTPALLTHFMGPTAALLLAVA